MFDPLGVIFRLVFETYYEVCRTCAEGRQTALLKGRAFLEFWSLSVIDFNIKIVFKNF
jgi:hypothetical protein